MDSTVGIVLRTRDRPILLKRALRSILQQTHRHWHISLVNDGGYRATLEATLQPFTPQLEGRLSAQHNETSRGMEAASNQAIAALPPTQFLTIHDDDDAWHPEFLTHTIAALQNPLSPAVRGIVTHTEVIEESLQGETLKIHKRKPYNTGLTHISLTRLLAENTFAPISFLFYREVYDEIGPFREDLPVLGDWEFNVRFLLRYEIALLPRILAYYHQRTAQSGPYATSLQAARDLHIFYDNQIRQEWLRQDIASGRPGLGFLAQQSRNAWDAERRMKRVAKRRFFPFI